MHRAALAVLLAFPLLAQEADLGLIDRIKAEAFDRSKVMDTLYYLTDVHGPRLTGSPEYRDAANWAMGRLKEYGVANVHTEAWGPFGRSWSPKEYSLEMIAPRYAQLDAAPLAWSGSSEGAVTGELVIAPLRASFRDGPKKAEQALKDYEAKWHGKLRGKIVLLSEAKTPGPLDKAQFRRYTDAELAEIAKSPEPSTKTVVKRMEDVEFPENPEELGKFFMSLPEPVIFRLYEAFEDIAAKRGEMFRREGVVAVLTLDERAHDGMVFAESAGAYKAGRQLAPPTFVITAEQFDRIARIAKKGEPIQMRANLKAEVSDRDVDGMNIIGEIPGTGPKKDEIVMIGAHFDSWHAGTGATDNAAGSAVMIEVLRILKAMNLPLNRTVRIALWDGEEQGIFGSGNYVKQHFADPKDMKLKPEHAKLSGYFNLDNGSGKIRGVYLQGVGAMRPIFESWLAPFRDMGASTVTIRNTSGTDHLSFAAVGLPGFQFIQDPLDYGTITHHSSMDTYDHAVPADLMQASAIIATCVYNAANRADMLPRPALPEPSIP